MIDSYAHSKIICNSFSFIQLGKAPRGTDHMNKISDKIKSGARAFLVTEYKYLTVYVIFICVILVILYTIDPPSGDETDGVRYAACFLCGAFLSGAAGWGGMAVATVSHSLKKGLFFLLLYLSIIACNL